MNGVETGKGLSFNERRQRIDVEYDEYIEKECRSFNYYGYLIVVSIIISLVFLAFVPHGSFIDITSCSIGVSFALMLYYGEKHNKDAGEKRERAVQRYLRDINQIDVEENAWREIERKEKNTSDLSKINDKDAGEKHERTVHKKIRGINSLNEQNDLEEEHRLTAASSGSAPSFGSFKKSQSDAMGFRCGQLVHHAKFGDGVILKLEDSGEDTRAYVNFGGSVGIKCFALNGAKLGLSPRSSD